MNIMAILSEMTCGEACWHAKELVCRCSCGGKNHGCLKTEHGTQPVRTSKIDGVMYELVAVGEYGDLMSEARKINESFPPRIEKVSGGDENGGITYKYHYHETDFNAPARLKPASKHQLESWAELTEQKTWPMFRKAYLLWKRCLVNQDLIKVA